MLLRGHPWFAGLLVVSFGNWLGGMTTYALGRLGKWSWLERIGIKVFEVAKFHARIQNWGSLAALTGWETPGGQSEAPLGDLSVDMSSDVRKTPLMSQNKNSRFRIFFLISLLAIIASGCSKSLAEKMEGTWTVNTISCNSVDVKSMSISPGTTRRMTFGTSTATTVDTRESCVRTEFDTATYSENDDKSLSITSGHATCSTEGCSLGNFTCNAWPNPGSPPEAYSVELSNDDRNVSLSMTIDCNGNTAGQETLTMTLSKN